MKTTQAPDFFNWYEANLPARERKRRGHFSTPPLLVERMLDACGYRPEVDLAPLRVLDPACGSGNFLVAVVRRLVAAGARAGLDDAAIRALVQRNVWGFDPDPVACFLAEMGLRTALSQASASTIAPSLHIHQADGLALSWEQCENVDLFLANPPYLAAKNSDLSGYRSTHQRGQADSYLLFLKLALQVVRPRGWIGLVLPDPVLARANAARERQLLLSQTTVHHLWHLAGVFQAYVGAVVIIAQKNVPAPLHVVTWMREKWQQPGVDSESVTIPQALLLKQPGYELRYLLSDQQQTFVAHLWKYFCTSTQDSVKRFAPLAQFVEIRRGEELGKGAALLREQDDVPSPEWLPVLRGGIDVRAYSITPRRAWIAREAVSKPLARYLAPKLLVVKSTGLLQAALDADGHVVLQTLYVLSWRGTTGVANVEEVSDELYFLLALLNSRLLQDYVRVLYTAYKWVQPQIEQHVLAQLPVPLVSVAQKVQIVQRAKLLMHACSTAAPVVELELYEEQERAIYALYHAALQASMRYFAASSTLNDKGSVVQASE
ncbi:MAG TPA: N-6 DNA methylase [Ktedonobacteraceae bacterium]|nr:N-6 DNA methylase [Ktedonobacteraceae bacterium]